jgi:hypothetical protein
MIVEMERVGFDVCWKDAWGNAFGLYRGTERGPAWLLMTHLDIVNVGQVERWKLLRSGYVPHPLAPVSIAAAPGNRDGYAGAGSGARTSDARIKEMDRSA